MARLSALLNRWGNLIALAFEKSAGVKFNHIPFAGGGPSVTALLGGHVNAVVVSPPEGIPHVKAGKLRIIALFSEKRMADFPDVATVSEQGVPFTPDPDGPLGLHLTREGGHAVRRIAHAADATGRAIHESLLTRARSHPNITMRERWMAVDLVTSRHLRRDEPARCYGVYALDIDRQHIETLPAAAVVLATGGVGKVYRYTSNPDTATGDGIAMAYRAGAAVAAPQRVPIAIGDCLQPAARAVECDSAERVHGESKSVKAMHRVDTGFVEDHNHAGDHRHSQVRARSPLQSTGPR